jgi:hypothetical protein
MSNLVSVPIADSRQTTNWNVNHSEMPKNTHLPRRRIVQCLAAAGMIGSAPAFASSTDGQAPQDHVAWVAESLKHMLAIKPGMSRDQLLRVFSSEGGISTALQRTFVSRDCPFFKVDVTFHRATGFNTNTNRNEMLRELDSDVIASVSRPYLEFSIMD